MALQSPLPVSYLWKHLKRIILRKINSYHGYRIRELIPAHIVCRNEDRAKRINLIVLGIDKRDAYGGTSTALRFMNTLSAPYSRARIIVTVEDTGSFVKEHWPGWELDGPGVEADRTITFVKDLRGPLEVEPGDDFIATQWRTACYLSEIHAEQRRSGWTVKPWVYFIQDFEPGFYAWSSQYMIADSTYRSSTPCVAVFNTYLLKEYFDRNDYNFFKTFAFEPQLNPSLARRRNELKARVKQRLLLVYGRPSSKRNAFELVVESLILWAQKYENAGQWKVVSLGEPHQDVPLHGSLSLISKGKQSLDGYSEYLADASVGLSLMVSPHPSYPPLEMAEYGVRVVTNRFAQKDLSDRSPFITCLEQVDPNAIASALIVECERVEKDGLKATCAAADASPVFLGSATEFPFADEIVEVLHRQVR